MSDDSYVSMLISVFFFFKGNVEGMDDPSSHVMQALKKNPALTIQLTPGTSIELHNLSTRWKVLPVRTSAFTK